MKPLTILGILALFMLLVIPGAVSAADNVTVSGSIAQPAPTAAFTISPQTGNTPLSVSFTDTSTVSLGTINSWTWEYRLTGTDTWTLFADSTEQNSTQDFATGVYDIRLTASAGGVSDDETKLRSIAVSAGPKRLTTVQSGTVSGDMSVQAFGHFTTTTSYVTNTAEDTFTLPAAAVGNVQWARLYTVVFGSSTDNREGTAVVSFDGNGDGTYETILGTETMAIPSDSTANVYVVNDHVDKQYLNYQIQYDVTSLISSTSPKAKVVVTPVTSTFDGRINGITLVVAYNDGDSDVVKYWVNDGFDFQPSTASAVTTTFETNALPSDLAAATLTNVHLSTKDATYTFNTNPLINSGTGLPSFDTNIWDVKDYMTAGSDASLTYAHAASSSFKTTLAALKVSVKEPAPVIDFTGTPTSGTSPLTVAFTATNTGGAATSYDWTFGDGQTQTTNGPTVSHTYTTATPQTYTVSLIAHGPDYDSNTVTKENYISVGAQIIEVTVNPTSINFGSMQAGVDETGNSTVSVDVTGGTAWSVTGSASNGGYMGTGTVNLANPFQLSKTDGSGYQDMNVAFSNFLTGSAGVDGSGPAYVKQVIDAADGPGAYSITLTFTGQFEI